MIKWFFLVLLLSFTLGTCAQPVPDNLHKTKQHKMPYTSKVLKEYVAEWVADVEAHGINLDKLDSIDSIIIVSPYRVICESYTAIGCAADNKVLIRHPYSLTTDMDLDSYFRELVYHELGHAVLGLKHSDLVFGVMNSSAIPYIELYRNYWTTMKLSYFQYYFTSLRNRDLLF